MTECYRCGFNDEDYGCTCPHSDKWYACPIESKKPQNQKTLEEYAKWASKYQDEFVINEERIYHSCTTNSINVGRRIADAY